MLPLPTRFAGIILAFAPLFVHRSWRHAQPLLIGAILTPGRRTVTSVLRILGRARGRRFVNVHRILNRTAWCPRYGSRILLGLLIDVLAQRGPVVLGLPYTIHTVLTDNGIQFTDNKPVDEEAEAKAEAYWATQDGPRLYRWHSFEWACEQTKIEHRLTKPRCPWTNGQVERMNRTIKDATVNRAMSWRWKQRCRLDRRRCGTRERSARRGARCGSMSSSQLPVHFVH